MPERADAATPKPSRSDVEAKRLLEVASARLPAPGRCGIDTSWGEEPLPDYAAHTVFKYAMAAGLVPPSGPGDLRSIVDPHGRLQRSAFCTNDELKTYAAQRVSDFERGSEERMEIDRVTFDYPIFDEKRKTAVLVVSRSALEGRFRWNGRVGRHPASVGIEAEVFRKRGGRWRFVRDIELGIS